MEREDEGAEGGWSAAMCGTVGRAVPFTRSHCSREHPSSRMGAQLSLRDWRTSATPSPTSKVALESAHTQTSRPSSPQHCD